MEATLKRYGDSALLIEWPSEISEVILAEIIEVQRSMENQLSSVLIETVNAYNSLTVIYDQEKIGFNDLEVKINTIIQSIKKGKSRHPHYVWEIPVCYDDHFGIDLYEIALAKKMSKEEIISLHVDTTYLVHFIGFLPGFLYLGGLHPDLHFPRKSTPRLKISKGAVAIGGQQTGIYPSESPGGWNIIGSSPVVLFNVYEDPPCVIKPGDSVKFYSIDIKTYASLKKDAEDGRIAIKKESV